MIFHLLLVDYGGIDLRLQNIFFLFCSDWIAIGFSNYGEFDNADFCVFWIDWKGKAHLQVRLKNVDFILRVYQ